MTIGVAAVITMVALGTGAQDTVADDVRSAGTNLIRVDAGNYTRGGEESKIATGLGAASTLDARRCGRDRGGGRRQVRIERREAARLGRQRTTREYLQIARHRRRVSAALRLAAVARQVLPGAGRRRRAAVAVLGSGARDRLFGAGVNPVGRDIAIRDAAVRVVGVVSGGDDDQMDAVYVPFTMLQRVLDIRHIHSVVVAAAQAGDATRAGGRDQAAAAAAPSPRRRRRAGAAAPGRAARQPGAERDASACPTTSP